MTLSRFTATVRACGGVWASPAVTFSRSGSCFAANYGDSQIIYQFGWFSKGAYAPNL